MTAATGNHPHHPRDPWRGYGLDRPTPARFYDCLTGGKDNFPVDRDAAKAATQIDPEVPAICEATRTFVIGATFAAARDGITQFLDLGCGLPAAGCEVHDAARAVKPGARVVYVDADPEVAAHSRAMREDYLTGFTAADLLDPAQVLSSEAVKGLLDFTRPVAVLMTAALHWCLTDIRPAVQAYKDACPPGSRLFITHAASDGMPPVRHQRFTEALGEGPARFRLRPAAEITALFDGWTLPAAGLTDVRDWPGPPPQPPARRRLSVLAGVAAKP